MSDQRVRPQYSRDEVEEILRRAAERTHEGGADGLTHDELVAAAREAGIDTTAVESAVTELAIDRQDRLAVEHWNARRRSGLVSHFTTWLVVNGGLFLINLLAGGVWWFFWPMLAWGIFVALHAASALRAPTPDQVQRVTRRARRKRESERRREARRAEREARRKHGAGRDWPRPPPDFERAVEAGVSALLSMARRIDDATRPPPGPLPDTEFNRWVTQKKQGVTTPAPRVKGAPTRAPNGPEGPRVRIDADDERERERDDDDDEQRPVPPRRARR